MKRYDAKRRILGHFLQNPTARLRVRQIERLLNVPLPSVTRYTKELEKENLLTKITISDVHFFTANRAAPSFVLEKKIYNLRNVFDSGLIPHLEKLYGRPTAVLFGSYARGEDIEESDIDLYIETPSKKRVALEKFHWTLGRKIQVFRYKSLHDVENRELANNIANGITLLGFLEVV